MKHIRQYIVAADDKEALDLKRSLGGKALFIAGGTTVVPKASEQIEVVIDINHLGLGVIDLFDDRISIGATTRLSNLCTSTLNEFSPLLGDAVMQCATPLVRNLATIGGCVETSFLPSDVTLALLALGSQVEILKDDVSLIPIERLVSGEVEQPYLIRRVIVPRQRGGHGFIKLGRSKVDIGLVNVATVLDLEDRKIVNLSIALGQSSSTPVVMKEICESKKGKEISLELVESIASDVANSIKPRSDFRASSWYRKQVIFTLVARCLVRAGNLFNEDQA